MTSYSLITPEEMSITKKEEDSLIVDNGRVKASHGRVPRLRLALDILLLLCTLFMILWPWGVLAVLGTSGGIELPEKIADWVVENPQLVSALVTFIGTLNRIMGTFLFGSAITRYGQEFIATKSQDEAVTVFGVSAFMAFRHMSLVWGLADWKALGEKGQRSLLVLLFFAALGSFATIPSGTASLIAPSRFNKSQTGELKGQELDFTSQHDQCLSWLGEGVRFPSGWCRQTVQGSGAATGQTAIEFASSAPPVKRRALPANGTCLSENLMLDILDSGRDNMLTLPHQAYKVLPRLLSAEAGVPFLGSTRGVLPLGPDGIPRFHSLWSSSSLFNNSRARKGVLAYNYTMQQQGLINHVTCVYSDTSPITFTPDTPEDELRYSGACENGQSSLYDSANIQSEVPDKTRNGLAFMACQSNTTQPTDGAEGPIHEIYLRGGKGPGYSTFVGNMTCKVSPMRSGILEVKYSSQEAYFATTDIVDPADNPASPPATLSTHPAFLQSSTHIVGELVSWAQRWNSNMVAESVSTVGVKLFNTSQAERDDGYLKLYAATIEGVLDYTVSL